MRSDNESETRKKRGNDAKDYDGLMALAAESAAIRVSFYYNRELNEDGEPDNVDAPGYEEHNVDAFLLVLLFTNLKWESYVGGARRKPGARFEHYVYYQYEFDPTDERDRERFRKLAMGLSLLDMWDVFRSAADFMMVLSK